jgi:hypothetical protein
MGGSAKTCPSCHGTGRRAESVGFYDVTKTKPSHHRQSNQSGAAAKPTWPTSFAGAQLAAEVRDCPTCPEALRTRLIAEIMEHEQQHANCTQTFIKKVRKQLKTKP